MNYTMIYPCPHCPFRNDIPGFLTTERAEEIVDAITTHQQSFTCHETTIDCEDEDGEGDRVPGPKAQHCAGAMIMLEHQDQPNQMMRIAERLGFYDKRKLNMDAPVYDDPEDFIEAQRQ